MIVPLVSHLGQIFLHYSAMTGTVFFAIYGHSHISLWLLLDSPADKQLAKPFTFYIGFTRSKSSSLARERPSMLKGPVFSGHHSVVKQLKVNWKPFHLPAFVR